MSAKYYTNPFDDDDDDEFESDVEVEEILLEEAPARGSNRLASSYLKQRREDDLAIHEEDTLSNDFSDHERYVVNQSNYRAADNESSSERNQEIWGRGPTTNSFSQHNRNEDILHTEKANLMEDYESSIRSLRAELKQANSEHHELRLRISKLESEVRLEKAEKENNAFLHRQEKERNALLLNEVEQLKDELNAAHEKHQQMLQQLHQSHQEEVSRTALSTSHSFQEENTLPVSRHVNPCAPMTLNENFTSERHVMDISKPPSAKPPNPQDSSNARVVRARGKGDPTVSSWTIGEPTPKLEKQVAVTKEKPATKKEREEEVHMLEQTLFEHSKLKDELSSQLTRLETTRVRNAVERRKKSVVEQQLEEEEKTIQQIRLKLRNLSALTR